LERRSRTIAVTIKQNIYHSTFFKNGTLCFVIYRFHVNKRLIISGGVVGLLFIAATYWGMRAGLHSVLVRPTIALAKITGAQTGDLLQGQWSYIPGVSRTATGLKVEPQGFVIVNQDGSGGQPNPAVNLLGTHLEHAGDLTITATLSPGDATASLRLYGQAPVIADEFRVERKSIDFAIHGTDSTIRLWDGSSQNPVATQTFKISAASTIQLVVTRNAGVLTMAVNGARIGALPEHGIFSDGAIWFGLDAQGSGWTLTSLRADGNATVADGSHSNAVAQSADSLQALASKKRPGFTIGAAVAAGPLATDAAYRAIALGQFGALTTENALKWQSVHPQPNQYDFQEADGIINLAAAHGLKVHAHTLVFGEANPKWVQDLPTTSAADKKHMEQVMLDHIAMVAGHFKGSIASWDVVNEPLADYDTFDPSAGTVYRNHKWYQAMGKDYIPKAFAAAHAADPGAKLFINEYGLEADGDRWDTFLALITQLKKQNVPVDGVGFQAHVYERNDKIDPVVLRRHIQQLASIGLQSRISEMDVYSEDGQQVQAQQYAAVLSVCLQEPSCVSFTTWGVSDAYDYFKDTDGSLQQGDDFLYDAKQQPTPAVGALQKALISGD
jgi:endo-1,4-beta-xylanase